MYILRPWDRARFSGCGYHRHSEKYPATRVPNPNGAFHRLKHRVRVGCGSKSEVHSVGTKVIPMPAPAIVTVDDEPEVLRAVERDLRRKYGKDYRILGTDSGSGAVDLLKQLKTRGDSLALTLADQRMPQMSGLDVLGESMQLFPQAKRALLTAYADTNA